ncbi:MAG TPA: long-chain fatty acid--CoA ligase [Desulfomonilia bacterium]
MSYRNDTLCGLFHSQALHFGSRHVFLMGKFDEDGNPSQTYSSITWEQARNEVIALARGLRALGLGRGDRAVIFSESRPRWIIADQAIQACGAIGVPFYPTVSMDELVHMIGNCEPKLAIVSTVDKAIKINTACEGLQRFPVIVITPFDGERPDNSYSLNEAFRLGEKISAAEIEECIQRVIPDDIASIIYTSGTTGLSKGVVISQGNWMANIIQCTNSEMMRRQKELELHLVSLIHLPLCHSYARTSDYHVSGLYLGGTLAFARDYKTLQEDLLEIRPNIITSIPMFFEKSFERVKSAVAKQKKPYRKIFDLAMKIGKLYCDSMATGKKMNIFQLIAFAQANNLVFNRIRELMGLDRLVLALSGGGKLSKEVCTFFRSLGIQLNEGYGLTETSPVINFNEPAFIDEAPKTPLRKWIRKSLIDMTTELMVVCQSKGISPYSHPALGLKLALTYYTLVYKMRVKPGTVGRPVIGTIEKVAEDGELLVKGPQIFKGYWRMPEETAAAFTDDGWFKTGDIGRFDSDGFLEITDRKKELFVTTGGKNIAPHPIEVSLIARPYIDQVCLVGDNRKFISALIIPDYRALEKFARGKNIPYNSIQELVNLPEIESLIQKEIDFVNARLARFEQIRTFRILANPFDISTGELTPTMKVKRRVVYEKFKSDIEKMYTQTN